MNPMSSSLQRLRQAEAMVRTLSALQDAMAQFVHYDAETLLELRRALAIAYAAAARLEAELSLAQEETARRPPAA